MQRIEIFEQMYHHKVDTTAQCILMRSTAVRYGSQYWTMPPVGDGEVPGRC